MAAVAHLVRVLLLLAMTASAAAAGEAEVRALVDAAVDPAASAEARTAAVAELAQVGPAAAPLLAARLRNPDPTVRATAAAALAQLPADALADDRIAPVLLDLFQRDPDPVVRANAGLGLGATGDSRALAPLLSALESDDRTARLIAVLALRRLDDRDAIGPLAGAAPKEHDQEIQRNIVMALGSLGAFRELVALRAVVGDPVVAADIDAQLAPIQPLVDREAELARAAKEAEAPAAAPPTASQLRYFFLQRHRVLLVRLAVLLLVAPAVVLGAAGVASGVRAAALRTGVMIVAGGLAVIFGGLFSVASAGVARADPGSALVLAVPFLEALMTVPVAMCAAAARPRAGGPLAEVGLNAATWGALYAVLQFGTWLAVPCMLQGNYFWYGQHPGWTATHAGHAMGIAVAALLTGWLAARLQSAVRLGPALYAAAVAACGASTGLGYLIVNLYAY